jgi:hypothetical protein
MNLRNFGVIPEIASEGMKQLKKHLSVLFKKSNSTKTKTSNIHCTNFKITAQ